MHSALLVTELASQLGAYLAIALATLYVAPYWQRLHHHGTISDPVVPGTRGVHDQLPAYDDDVSGFPVTAPYGSFVEVPEEMLGVPVHNPSHPSFPTSTVMVPISAVPSLPVGLKDPSFPVVPFPAPVDPASMAVTIRVMEESEELLPRRSLRTTMRPPQSSVQPPPAGGGGASQSPREGTMVL